MIEAKCIDYLKNTLLNKFEFIRLFDGCKADIAIKPKYISPDVDEWIGIQVKSTEKKVKNNTSYGYKFDLSKDYENFIIICICLEDKKSWIFENNLISHIKSGLTISDNSKYNQYKIENNIESILENYYNNISIKKFILDELKKKLPQIKTLRIYQ